MSPIARVTIITALITDTMTVMFRRKSVEVACEGSGTMVELSFPAMGQYDMTLFLQLSLHASL